MTSASCDYLCHVLLQGDTVASVDSYGVVKLFDVRTVAPVTTVDCGPHPANRVAFDPTGNFLLAVKAIIVIQPISKELLNCPRRVG